MTKEVRFLLQRALLGCDTLPPDQRVTLYEGISQVTTGKASDEAKRMAFWHKQLVAQQQDFMAALFGKKG